MENIQEKQTDNKTIYVQPNKTPYQNRFFNMQVEIMDGFTEQVKDMSLYKQYEQELHRLTQSGATLQDRSDFEINYIKRDIDRLGQCYFKNYMNYFEYFAALINVINAWNICRNNWNIQHPQIPVENEQQEVHESPQRNVEETTQSSEEIIEK